MLSLPAVVPTPIRSLRWRQARELNPTRRSSRIGAAILRQGHVSSREEVAKPPCPPWSRPSTCEGGLSGPGTALITGSSAGKAAPPWPPREIGEQDLSRAGR